eukprot:6191969-Pleurochrysis_carterae.AAC.1
MREGLNRSRQFRRKVPSAPLLSRPRACSTTASSCAVHMSPVFDSELSPLCDSTELRLRISRR